MKHFTAIYMMPVEGLEEWGKKPEAERKDVESAMRADWQKWLTAHGANVLNTVGLGKTKRVTIGGVADAKNGTMLSSYVQAESLDAATALFVDHPHLGIPGAWIDIMEANPLS